MCVSGVAGDQRVAGGAVPGPKRARDRGAGPLLRRRRLHAGRLRARQARGTGPPPPPSPSPLTLYALLHTPSDS